MHANQTVEEGSEKLGDLLAFNFDDVAKLCACHSSASQKKNAMDDKLLCSREEMSRTSFLVVGILGILRQHP